MIASYALICSKGFRSHSIIFFQIHSSQVENDYKEKLDNEVSAKKELEKVCCWLVSLDTTVLIFKSLIIWNTDIEYIALSWPSSRAKDNYL